MKEEIQQNFTISDIVNIAWTKQNSSSKISTDKSLSKDMSANWLSAWAYENIWNAFSRWCIDQTELSYIWTIYQFGNMFSVSHKYSEGIIIKLSELFLREHHLQSDESNQIYDKEYKLKFAGGQTQEQKLNYILLSTELSTKKIIVQTGLNNWFNAIGTAWAENKNCKIDLGVLGYLIGTGRVVHQIPMKEKNEASSNKKATIKTWIDKSGNMITILKDPNRNIAQSQEIVGLNYNTSMENSKLNELGTSMELQSGWDKNKIKIHIKGSRKKPRKWPPVKQVKLDRVIEIPNLEENWVLPEMWGATFKRIYIQKAPINPVIFNVYSNTKAAPFTAEKTQIPVAHRIGSFYTLSLQNFIVDKESKNINRLYDEYFYKYKNIKCATPATEWEEYLYLLEDPSIDGSKIEEKRNTYKKYKDIIANYISDSFIAEMKSKWWIEIVRLSNRPYCMKNYEPLLNQCLFEITNDYKVSMKTSIVDYIIKHPEQREKLNIPMQFRKIKEYGEEQITRPSDGDQDWKLAWRKNKIAISNTLYIMCENITKIMKYFILNLKDSTYIELSEEDNSWPTLKLANFVKIQKNKIETQRQVINEEWKKFVEEILKENTIYKDQLILYFKSVCGVMSSQLRQIIVNSIRKYHTYMKEFKKEKYYSALETFNNQFAENFIFQKSFIEVDIKEHENKDQYTFSEEWNEIHSKLTNVIKEIIKCSQGVERADNLFIKNPDKHANLWQVPWIDSVVNSMYGEVDNIINENLEVLSKVTDLYKPFIFLMKEDEEIAQFIKRFPTRVEYHERIKMYQQKEEWLEKMPNNLYMNLIKVNCTDINEIIRKKLDLCINTWLKGLLQTNIMKKHKKLAEECEGIFNKFSIQIQSEKELFEMESFFDTCQSETVPHLFMEYEDFLEWVFFYLKNDTYNVFEPSKDTLNSFEQTIKNCHDNFARIETTMKAAAETIESTKKKFSDALEIVKSKWNDNVTILKNSVEDYKTHIKDKIVGENTLDYLRIIESLNSDAWAYQAEWDEIVKKEGYLGSGFTTEDERVGFCINELAPLIAYFSFLQEINICKERRANYLYLIDFSKWDELIAKMPLFDQTMPKIPTYKDCIQTAKADFEKFKQTIEFGKTLSPLVEWFQYDNIKNSEIYQDNQFFCVEVSKYFPTSYQKGSREDIQNQFGEWKLGDIYVNRKIWSEGIAHISKLVNEWSIISSMFQMQPKMMEEVDIKFSLEKLNNKEFTIISKDSFVTVLNKINQNWNTCNEKLNLLERPSNEIEVVKLFLKFKAMLEEIKEMTLNIEKKQNDLVMYMSKFSEIKKNDGSQIWKQAEKQFKMIIDIVHEQGCKINVVSFEKSRITPLLKDLEKLFKDIDKCWYA